MREIKFRAWDRYRKKMVFNTPKTQLRFDSCGDWYIWTNTKETLTSTFNAKLMQYTGLKDKKGVEIYEGDIQKSTLGRHYFIYVVKSIGGQFGNTLFSMTVKDNLSMDDNEEYYTFIERKRKNEIRNNIKSGDRIEVIGNIYENPGLLN